VLLGSNSSSRSRNAEWYDRSLTPTRMYSRLSIGDHRKPFTDYSKWRLLVSESGRHTWHYLKTDEECEKWPQNSVDKFWLGLDLVRSRIHHGLCFNESIFRIILPSLLQKTPSLRQKMAIPFTKLSSRMTATGPESTAALCFSYPDLSLAPTYRAWASRWKRDRK
jgi:hypothetical protein